MDTGEYRVWMEKKANRMSWFPTMDLRFVIRFGDGATIHQGASVAIGRTALVLQQRFEKRWGQDVGGSEWRDIPVELPESEGQISAPITSTETAESPARQSGSAEVDPSGERQILPKDR